MNSTAESSATSRTSVSYDAEAPEELQLPSSEDQLPLIPHPSGHGTAQDADLPASYVLSRVKLDKLYS